MPRKLKPRRHRFCAVCPLARTAGRPVIDTDHHCNLPDGVRDPEHAKPRHAGDAAELDELIRVNETARNSLINLEDMSDIDVESMKAAFAAIASNRNIR